MTCMPQKREFEPPPPAVTLIFVDMRCQNIPSGIKRTHASTVVQNCRQALNFARDMNIPIAFVRGDGSDETSPITQGPWIEGFHPKRQDAVLHRRKMSCYSSPYLHEKLAQTNATAVIAGFLGQGGALATGADAFFFGHKITFLSDAIIDGISDRIFNRANLEVMRQHTPLDIATITTAEWIITATTHTDTLKSDLFTEVSKEDLPRFDEITPRQKPCI